MIYNCFGDFKSVYNKRKRKKWDDYKQIKIYNISI